MSLNTQVRSYWERVPCGTSPRVTGTLTPGTKDWYEAVESYRYRMEPFIHSVAQFPRHHGKTVLEIGVGAGTDHLQWARAGAVCHGVDLTEAAIEVTRQRFQLYGFSSQLQRVDAETLPFPDQTFDVVYSWGVIHHSESPDRIVREIRRVLQPGGVFIGMVYGRRSPAVVKAWVRRALLAGKPWRSFADVVWHHIESVGTKAYTPQEVRALLSPFARVELQRLITPYDTSRFPKWLGNLLPNAWGWNIGFHAFV